MTAPAPVRTALSFLRADPSQEVYEPERVRALIREVVGGDPGETQAPFSRFISEGASVLVKPNWVTHRNEGGHGMDCIATHSTFVEEVLRAVLLARPGRVVLADAPIQGCLFDELVGPAARDRLRRMGEAAGVPVEVIDLRRSVLPTGRLRDGVERERRPLDRYVLFDLAGDSLLEPLSAPGGQFRVGDYDHRELAKTHATGRHQYLLAREAFEADVVLSLPKLKTHCKAGMTGALKNLVGLNGNKDYLPHHRFGGSERGGDNYEGASAGRLAAEWLQDRANQWIGHRRYRALSGLARAARLASGGNGGRMGGAWYGNDTCWRMALDLNRILLYGNADGTMSEAPRRVVHSLTDALICGQGEGPLRSEPLYVGAVTFADNSVAADLLHAHLLGFDPQRLPIVREAARSMRWPLLEPDRRVVVDVRGDTFSLEEAASACARRARPARFWVGHIEKLDATPTAESP